MPAGETRQDKAEVLARFGVVVDPLYVISIDGTTAVRYIGLLDAADKIAEKLSGRLSQTRPHVYCEPTPNNNMTTIVSAGFTIMDDDGKIIEEWHGIGDANPDNVDPMIEPHCPRMAETRAKARALRDLCRVSTVAAEELFRDSGRSRMPATGQNDLDSKLAELGEAATSIGMSGRSGIMRFIAETLEREPDGVSYDNLTVKDVEKCLERIQVLRIKEVSTDSTKGDRADVQAPTESKGGVVQDILDLYTQKIKENASPEDIRNYIGGVLEREPDLCDSKKLRIAELRKVRNILEKAEPKAG